MNAAEALRAGGIDAREARILLSAAAGISQASIVAFPERALAPGVEALFLQYAKRRKGGEPVAYILGRQEFYGLELSVGPGALIPRPETELLVDLALQLGFSSVADLGTGSGAIALALKRANPACDVIATDVSAAALAVARRNAERLGLAIELVEASWWQGLEGRRFDIAVANPPYVAAGDPHLDALRHEPALALTPGGDGFGALRAIVAGAGSALVPGGWLLLEHGFDQAAAVRELLASAGFTQVETRRDLAGLERATGGRGPPG